MEADARRAYDRGAESFRAGDYEAAIDHFESSYRLSHRAELLFNIGTAADRLGRLDRAIEAYEGYLAELADAPNRDIVERRVAELHVLRRAATEPEPEPVPEPTPPSAAVDPAPWILVGVGGAIAIGGAILIGVAAADVASVDGAPRGASWEAVRGAYERSEPLSIAGGVALGVGLAMAVGGIVWWASSPSPTAEPTARLRIAPLALILEGTL